MFANQARQVDRLQNENERLKAANAKLSETNEALRQQAEDALLRASIETARAQKILLDCEIVKEQWQSAIEKARISKINYDTLYKKCFKLAKKQPNVRRCDLT